MHFIQKWSTDALKEPLYIARWLLGQSEAIEEKKKDEIYPKTKFRSNFLRLGYSMLKNVFMDTAMYQ
jgi:hypothetical protein